MGDLVTWRVLPVRGVDYIDPFLFLNHHGPQQYRQGNRGLPFGPHPHRGIETVTFILDGDIVHEDNSGHKSTITAGGVQWMTAGRGLIHSENSSQQFKEQGGPLEILQLWINLPAKHKMTEPWYKGFQKDALPTTTAPDGKTIVEIIAGAYGDTRGAVQSVSGVNLYLLRMENGGTAKFNVPESHNIFFYLIKGAVTVNEKEISGKQLVRFANEGKTVEMNAADASVIIFGHAQPFNEPVVASGPFVMNTEEQIDQAYEDYHAGRFGSWK